MAASAAFVSDPRFGRTFELPSDPEAGRSSPLRVKYADYGYRNEAHPEQENVLLLFGPLFGSRLIHIAKDRLATERKIRVIHPDRPGFGGTDPLPAEDSMRLWRAVLSGLLQHLGIQHVSVACHSGGTVSAIDMLLHHPEILHPQRPYLAIAGPWILPKHTGSSALAIAHSLPAGILGQTDKVARLIQNYIGPAVGASVGVSYGLVAKLLPAKAASPVSEDSGGEGARFEERVWSHIMKQAYAEGVRGVSTDAVLLMQKGMPAGWSDWGDYDTAVRRLAEIVPHAVTDAKLTVEVFYAEKDLVIGDAGTKGPRWFDQCWAPYSEVFHYRSSTVQGSDHDGLLTLRRGAVQSIFQSVGVDETITTS